MNVPPPSMTVHPPRSVWVVLLASPLDDGSTLARALVRARRVAPDERILVVAHGTDPRVQQQAGRRPRLRVIDQPADRGTTPGVLLALVRVLEEDPTARVAVVPCDRAVADDEGFVDGLRSALYALLDDPGAIRVIGPIEAPAGVVADGWTLAAALFDHAPLWFGALAPALGGISAVESAFAELAASDFERDVIWPARAAVCVVPLRARDDEPRVPRRSEPELFVAG